jgi:hypothetical protein
MNQARGQIMEVIIRSRGSLFEEIVLECPGLTWNQVFCELDRMSRTGEVRLTAKAPGLYAVTSATTCALSPDPGGRRHTSEEMQQESLL